MSTWGCMGEEGEAGEVDVHLLLLRKEKGSGRGHLKCCRLSRPLIRQLLPLPLGHGAYTHYAAHALRCVANRFGSTRLLLGGG